MKRLLTILNIFVFVILLNNSNINAQSCNPPECGYSAILTSNPGQNYVNNFNNASGKDITCFTGNSSVNRITANMDIHSIKTMIFKANAARYECITPVNMQGNNKIYIEEGVDLTISHLSMNGGDTIFVAGNLHINSVQNVNNSVSTNRAVIIIKPGGFVDISGSSYTIGSIFQSGGSTTNQIHILQGCVSGTLPVKFIKVSVKLITK